MFDGKFSRTYTRRKRLFILRQSDATEYNAYRLQK